MSSAVGVEIGPTAVHVVIAERAGAQTRVAAIHDAPCDTANLDVLTRTLSQLRRSIPITQPILLGLPSTSTILSTVSPLVVNVQRAELAVQFELQQQLPFELAAAVWHYRWLVPTRTPNPQRVSNAVVVAMKREIFDERLACCRRAGLSVQAVIPSAVAAFNAWHAAQRTPQRAASAALIRVLNDQSAEWILWGSGGLQVVPVSSPTPEALAQDVAAAWSALQGQPSARALSVWVAGASPARRPVQEALSAQGAAEVQPFDVAQAAAAGKARPDELEGAIAAVGLALQGLGSVRVSLNLLDRLQGEERARAVHHAAVAAGSVLALVAIGLSLSGMLEVRRRRMDVLESLEQRERLYQSLRPDVRALLQRQQHTQRRMQQLERAAVEAGALTDAVAQVAAVLPDGVWLTKLDGSRPVAGSAEILLEGRAKTFQDVTQFLDRLKAIPGVALVKPLSTSVVSDAAAGKEEVVFAVQVQRSGGRR